MKILVICLTALFLLSGCSQGGAGAHITNNNASAVQSVLDSGVAAADNANADSATADAAAIDEEEAERNAFYDKLAYNEKEGIDIDLTRLKGNMIFSQVNRMIYEPEEFIGKTVRMAGRFAFAYGYDEEGEVDPERVYFACIIPDATACCSSGIEFDRAGDWRYPDDYPNEGDDITVTGVFELYEEDGFGYVHLVNAVMEA